MHQSEKVCDCKAVCSSELFLYKYEIHCNVDAMRFAMAIPCNVLVCVIFLGLRRQLLFSVSLCADLLNCFPFKCRMLWSWLIG